MLDMRDEGISGVRWSAGSQQQEVSTAKEAKQLLGECFARRRSDDSTSERGASRSHCIVCATVTVYSQVRVSATL